MFKKSKFLLPAISKINLQFEIISANIKKAYLQLQLEGDEFTVEDIFNLYIGKPTAKEVGTIHYFKEILEKKKKLVGIDIQLDIWKKTHLCSISLVGSGRKLYSFQKMN